MSQVPQSGVVTPEAVVLQFRAAGLGSRIAAASLDLAIWGTAYAITVAAGALITAYTDIIAGWLAITLLTFLTFVLLLLYPVIFETCWGGRTPGKAALGLRVVTSEGAPIRFRQAVIRSAVGLFEIFLTSGFAASVAIFTGDRGKRVGDHAAGTIVLRERNAETRPRSYTFSPPAGAEQYTSTLDVSALTPAEYVTMRSFVVRAATLDRAARLNLGNELGRRFATRLRTQPPATMTAENFLLCVVAAYQRRFAAS